MPRCVDKQKTDSMFIYFILSVCVHFVLFLLLFLICFVDFFKEREREVGRLWEELEKRKNKQNRLHEFFLKKNQRLTVQNQIMFGVYCLKSKIMTSITQQRIVGGE